MRRMLSVLLVLSSGWAATAAYRSGPPPAPGPFPDVASSHWAAPWIKAVAVDRDWLRNFGPKEFRPAAPLLRGHLARAAVLAFAPREATPSTATFRDVRSNDPLFRFAAVAATRGWMPATRERDFRPDARVTKAELAVALTRALGLGKELAGLDAIAAGGIALRRPEAFSALTLAGSLRLFRNHADEARELLPSSVVPRADAAYALSVASAAAGTWRIRDVQRFRSISLPAMSVERRAVVEFALAHAGYPYVKAGEWPAPTPKSTCCGAQPQGGFDCSGLVWWAVRRAGAGYNPAGMRPYAGWPLPERSSARMAQAAAPRLPVTDALPGDLLFSDVDGRGKDWEAIDHVGLALGGGWMIHASAPGVMLDWIATGWWAPRLRWARRIGEPPATDPGPAPTPAASGSAAPSSAASPSPSSR